MNLKLFEDLSEGSDEIRTAKNVLKYSLHLQYKLERQDELKMYLENGANNEFVEEIANQAWNLCKPLFLGCVTQWNFFGSEALADENDCSFARIIYQVHDFWPNTIKNQSIVSALFTLRSEFGKEEISAYEFEGYIMDRGFSSVKEKYLDSDGTWNKYKSRDESVGGDGCGTNLIRKFNRFTPRIKGNLDGYYKIDIDEKHQRKYRFPLWSTDFINFILSNENKKRILGIERNAFHNKKVTSLQDYDINISDLEDALKNESEEFNIVDSIMLQYIAERNFNYSAVREWIYLLLSRPDNLKERIDKLENTILNLSDKIEMVQREIERLKERKIKKEKEYPDIKEKCEGMKIKRESREKYTDIVKKLDDLQGQSSDLKKRQVRLEEEMASLKESSVDLKEILPIDIMLLIFELPNVFSRKYYMRYIIDSFEISHCGNTYFSQHDNPQRSAGNHIGKKFELLPRQVEWIKCSKSFLLFMTQMVFPICERCFFLLYQDAIINIADEKKWVSKGLKILEEYAEENADNIQKGGFPENEYREIEKYFGKRIGLSLDELLSENKNLSSYLKLDRSDRLAYDLLIKELIKNLPPIDNKSKGSKWEEDYFQMRLEDNKEHYAKLLDCYMKSMGIK